MALGGLGIRRVNCNSSDVSLLSLKRRNQIFGRPKDEAECAQRLEEYAYLWLLGVAADKCATYHESHQMETVSRACNYSPQTEFGGW